MSRDDDFVEFHDPNQPISQQPHVSITVDPQSATALPRVLSRSQQVGIIFLQASLVAYATIISGIFSAFAARRAGDDVPLEIFFGASSFFMNIFLAMFFAKRVENFAAELKDLDNKKKLLLALSFLLAGMTTFAGVKVSHDAVSKLLVHEAFILPAEILFCINTLTTRFVGSNQLLRKMAGLMPPQEDMRSLWERRTTKGLAVTFAVVSTVLIPMWSCLTEKGLLTLFPELPSTALGLLTGIFALSNPLFYADSCLNGPENLCTTGKMLKSRIGALPMTGVSLAFVTLGIASGGGYSKEMMDMQGSSFGHVFNRLISDSAIEKVYGPIHANYITMVIVAMVNMNGTAAFFKNVFKLSNEQRISFSRALLTYLGFIRSENALSAGRSYLSVNQLEQLEAGTLIEEADTTPQSSCWRNCLAWMCGRGGYTRVDIDEGATEGKDDIHPSPKLKSMALPNIITRSSLLK